ncbi:helix-turn-helix transcriptional regulator [Coraliomargarita akajimensis]|uniref:Transcriptional regulator, AraC family n=1 Tax=Coraliomargarita akajimensis (strain DSM 45221 / IAM 15411 / JCM 23193 / KCTC 12865 / 04OKA010-24) TaxID=583355 RepID=D5EQU8_CORAD|nr:AraC family transcriptional regulator [Coraliomargarita akajimensis]ADE53941.1 transcriptional regulator, AraC family [Coraliomargarita akajimensis DSM 45221]
MPDLIYQETRERYHVDACLPQLSALEQGKIDLHALTHGDYPGTALAQDFIPEISTMGYMDAVGQQDWGMEDHRNEGIEICLQESGNNTLSVDGKNYPMPAHTLSITRPWQLHRVGDPHLGPGRLHWIVIDVGVRRPNQDWQWPKWCILTQSDLAELTQLLRGSEHPVWKASSELIRIFQNLAEYGQIEKPEARASRMMIGINQLLIALLELLRSQRIETATSYSPVVRTVELFLNELQRNTDMLGNDWTLESMASHCGLGRSAFTKYCYQLQNISPINFLNRCRLNHAAERLRHESQASVTDIAFSLGFSSSQYFSRQFKQQFGKTPSQIRAESVST